MKRIPYLILVLIAIVSTAYYTLPLPSVEIDTKNVEIRVKGQHVNGTINGLAGEIRFDPSKPEGTLFQVTVDVKSLDLGDKGMTKHAWEKDWLDAEQFPTISYSCTEVARDGDNWVAKGKLTLHGVTQPAEIPFVYTQDGGHTVLTGSLKLNRRDYGMDMPSKVAQDLEISIKVPLKH